ncbi:MAG TPA: cytochrome P450 [Paenirhodobacter sp.]
MQRLTQSPLDPDFIQNPYPFYDRVRAAGGFAYWEDYGLPVTARANVTGTAFRDRRLGRQAPAEHAPAIPDHLKPFYAVEDHSMLELEGPHHARLRRLVLRAFTTNRIATLAPEIATLAHDLIDRFPSGGCDLITHFAKPIPVIIIARLLGVPEERADDLLRWSNAMVGMYQANRSRQSEDAAVAATQDFADFIDRYADIRRKSPGNDLISELLVAEEAGERLTRAELVTTCILLLNAGHEATVHTLGNGVKTLLETRTPAAALAPDRIGSTIEEILRYDPPLHMFTRWVYEDLELGGTRFHRGDRIGVLLGGANRDPQSWDEPFRFDPTRPAQTNFSFGAGAHFCLGAPLARLELLTVLPILFARLPDLQLAGAPKYADLYHFHGLERLDIHWSA